MTMTDSVCSMVYPGGYTGLYTTLGIPPCTYWAIHTLGIPPYTHPGIHHLRDTPYTHPGYTPPEIYTRYTPGIPHLRRETSAQTALILWEKKGKPLRRLLSFLGRNGENSAHSTSILWEKRRELCAFLTSLCVRNGENSAHS